MLIAREEHLKAEAEEAELIALEAEVKTLGPATDSGVTTSVPDGTAQADMKQEEGQAAAESEAGKTWQGDVSREWTAQEEEEFKLLAENLDEEDDNLAKRARLT